MGHNNGLHGIPYITINTSLFVTWSEKTSLIALKILS